MGKIIAVANQKGGVGKTTTCINLAAALKKRNRKVLLADCDPQGNSTSGMGVSKDRLPNIYDLIVRGRSLGECVESTPFGDVLPANRELSGATVELVDMEAREYVLKNALLPAREEYDYIFIDCPPSLELLTVNALAAADSVLIPVQCEYYALEGIADLMQSVRLTKRTLNPALEIQGIVLTMYDSRTNFSEQVAAGGREILRRLRVQDTHTARRPYSREPEPRAAGDKVRQNVPREQGLSAPRGRVPERGRSDMAAKKGLGAGLNALFAEAERDEAEEIQRLPISRVEPREEQPRVNFDEASLGRAGRIHTRIRHDTADNRPEAGERGTIRLSPASAAGARRAWPG